MKKYLPLLFLMFSLAGNAQTFNEYVQQRNADFAAYKAKRDSLFKAYVQDELERLEYYKSGSKPKKEVSEKLEKIERIYPKEIVFVSDKEFKEKLALSLKDLEDKEDSTIPEEDEIIEKVKENEKSKEADFNELKAEIEVNRPVMYPLPKGSYRVSSNFSLERLHPVYKKKRPHMGIDLAAPKGTKVYATADGVVLKSEYSRSGGHMVIIDHLNGYTTTYMHLNSRKMKTGEEVKRGEIVGAVGSTGVSTGPHLHYEIRKKSKAYDPAEFMIGYLE